MNTLRFHRPATAEGRFIRQSSSRDVYGHVILAVEPSTGRDLGFLWEVRNDQIPSKYFPAIQEGITDWLNDQGLLCVNTTVRVIGGSYNSTDSNAACYAVAASRAFEDAVKKASATDKT